MKKLNPKIAAQFAQKTADMQQGGFIPKSTNPTKTSPIPVKPKGKVPPQFLKHQFKKKGTM